MKYSEGQVVVPITSVRHRPIGELTGKLFFIKIRNRLLAQLVAYTSGDPVFEFSCWPIDFLFLGAYSNLKCEKVVLMSHLNCS